MTFAPSKLNSLSCIISTALFISLISCTHFEKNKSHQSVSNSSIAKGQKLAITYCQSCHLLPDPSLLDAKNWEQGVLPAMGPRLGIFDYGLSHYPSSKNDPNIDKSFYPAKPLLTNEEWQNIIDYYTALSPDTLPPQQRKYAIEKSDSLFTVEKPSFTTGMPTTCFVRIDTVPASAQVIISDVITKKVFRFNNQLRVQDSIQTTSPVVDIERHKEDMMVCNIGVMNPNDGKYGSAIRVVMNEKGAMKEDSSLRFGKLARPVQVNSADFNGDGKTDYLVCEFGNLVGALSWMENMGNNTFEHHVLRAVPGAIKAYIKDVNHDGLPDIWVLFAQGDEGIFLFTNKGNGKFDQEEVLRFPSIWGSSYFEFADFNHDGNPDILYTCGDNADYSAVLKPYHGVYVFMNDGKNHFKQEYFFPMYGCFKAVARDFDGDGDLDIAAIAFFGDYTNHPEETFVYLDNTGKMDFKPHIVKGTDAGRWLTMDANDIDGDGKPDIVLGNFSIAPLSVKPAANWKSAPSFIVLKNIMQKK